MTTKRIRIVGIVILLLVWAALATVAWLKPETDTSDAERRQLAHFPELNTETLFDGSFMEAFETYTLDQFPLRDTFRRLKALFHYNVFLQQDNNDIYIADGYAAEMIPSVDDASVDHAIKQFNMVYRLYLKDKNCKIYTTAVPDKGYYLAEESGHLSMDYEALFQKLETGMPWSKFVDITDQLSVEDYYRTDTHWRQEKLLPVAQKLASAMGVTTFGAEELKTIALERPFYGVYYGQAALPMEPETMYVVKNDLLDQCVTATTKWDASTKQMVTVPRYTGVHDFEMLGSPDLYDVYLSGLEEPVVIENPNAKTDKTLVVFRDSFGSSLAPLLVQDYAKIILVDIRAGSTRINSLGFIDFTNADVLFMYSTLVLNGGYI